MAMIRVEGLVERYPKAKRNAVDGIDFKVARASSSPCSVRTAPARRRRSPS